jgi:hypothetical protein
MSMTFRNTSRLITDSFVRKGVAKERD